MSSVCRAKAFGCFVEVGNGPGVGFVGGVGNTVPLDVPDKPVHFEDLPPLRLADFDYQFAHTEVHDLGAFGSGDGEGVVRDHSAHEGGVSHRDLTAV